MEQSEDYKSVFEFTPTILELQERNEIITQSLKNKEAESGSTFISRIVKKEDPINLFSYTAPNIDHYCRVCGSEISDQNLIFIFGKRGKDLSLEKKIFDYLHLEVKKNDHLPQKVCLTCVSHLNKFQQFLETSQTAASKLRQLFLPNKINREKDQIDLDKNGIIGVLEPELIDSHDTGGLEIDGCIRNVIDKKTLKARKKEKQQLSVLCHICGKAFKDMTNLHSHKRTHLPEELKKKYQCTICMKSFRTNFHLSEHMNAHLGVTPYTCPDCDKRFHSRALLRQHAQVHRAQADDKNKVECPKCGLLCSRKGNLRTHLKTHLEGRTFNCCVCQRQFPSFSEMLSHRKQHSQNEIRLLLQQDLIKDKDRVISCHLCDQIFTDKRILATHVERVHNGVAVEKHECGDCGKVLRSLRSLVYHQRSQHTGERPHRCSYCGEGFLLLKLLRAHETKHTGERPFKCDTCGKGFRSRNNLHQHSQKHGGERKFECIVCGKSFQRKAALEVHNRIHSGEKPFVCDLCGRGFTQKNDLLKHQKTHLECNSKTRTCVQCMMVFGSKKELLKHKEETHKDEIGVVPLIITNNMYETHVITEDGQKLVFPTVDGALGQNNVVVSSVTDVRLV